MGRSPRIRRHQRRCNQLRRCRPGRFHPFPRTGRHPSARTRRRRPRRRCRPAHRHQPQNHWSPRRCRRSPQRRPRPCRCRRSPQRQPFPRHRLLRRLPRPFPRRCLLRRQRRPYPHHRSPRPRPRQLRCRRWHWRRPGRLPTLLPARHRPARHPPERRQPRYWRMFHPRWPKAAASSALNGQPDTQARRWSVRLRKARDGYMTSRSDLTRMDKELGRLLVAVAGEGAREARGVGRVGSPSRSPRRGWPVPVPTTSYEFQVIGTSHTHRHAPFRGPFRQLGYARHPISCLRYGCRVSLPRWTAIVSFRPGPGLAASTGWPWRRGWRWHGSRGVGVRLPRGRSR